MGSYRVFISYSHEDRDLVLKIVKVLKDNGLTPIWDEHLSYGLGFPGQIKRFIAHVHVFLPIITETSSTRGWVHQEIGYAMALGVPMLPVALGALPREMISELHAIQLGKKSKNDKEWENQLSKELSKKVFKKIVDDTRRESHPFYDCAELQEDRTKMMADYAYQVSKLEQSGKVRQKGALSSFHIPDKSERHNTWRKRWGPLFKGENLCKLLRKERQELEEHAKVSGCDLIIDPYLDFGAYGPEARKTRLQTLLDFLESMSDDLVRVAINKDSPRGENLTIVGDWFAAYSISASLGKGYRQTIFTRHAPNIRNMIEQFDEEFEELLEESGWTAASSKKEAIKTIKGIVADIQSDLQKQE